MSSVALVYCDSYAYKQVYEAVSKGIDLLGGIDQFALAHERILLKPNLLTGANPERCITTHPLVFKAVGQIFSSTGAKVVFGDNPGVVSVFSAAKKSGFSRVAKELGIDFGDFHTYVSTHHIEHGIKTEFQIAKAVFDCNGVISIPKFKSHSFTRITGCVKNQFGCLPFLQKRIFHARLPDSKEFAKMLLRLNQSINPRLYIMDAIWAMEGDGPSAGTPKQLNVLGFSTDPIALDAVMCRIISLDPYCVPTLLNGYKFGYGEIEQSKIQILGNNIEEFQIDDFEINRSNTETLCENGLSGKIILQFSKRPVIIRDKCVNCGNCSLACPTDPKAIQFKHGGVKETPTISYNNCIRCYCCQEVCLVGAIALKIKLLC
jgi:uncharacterized protein (DUF362 family)/Pyruvate/2-oxoacid:ferredoxin oxidoreductase delta subunit